MYNLFERFRELPGLYSLEADIPIYSPYFEIRLQLRRVIDTEPEASVVEANKILETWVSERNATCDRAAQERMCQLIEPIVVDKQIWAYPDAHAVMRVPVKKVEALERCRVVRPFRVTEIKSDFDPFSGSAVWYSLASAVSRLLQ